MRTGLGELAPELADRMTSADSGFIDRNDPFHKKRSWIVLLSDSFGELVARDRLSVRRGHVPGVRFRGNRRPTGFGRSVALMFIVAFVSRSIARPIVDLAAAVRKVAAGNLDFQLPPKSSEDEVGELTLAFNKMVQDLRNEMEAVKKSTAEKQRIASELDIAYRIQKIHFAEQLPNFFRRARIRNLRPFDPRPGGGRRFLRLLSAR